ncbi:MAG TPA: hypothetical protein VNY74_07125 [Edaphobacter sp.]|jgi:hypothetical protein|nr:hypothetical protein [Edaphobacter sp.]
MKNAGMKNAGIKYPGEAIEKVLAGLRDADAPAGMERRILDGLEERAAARSRSGWRGWLPVWLVAPARSVAVGSLVCGAALTGIFVIALAIPAIRRLGHAPLQVKGNAVPAGSLREANPEAAKRVRPALSRPGLRSVRVTAEAGETSAGSVEAGMTRVWDRDLDSDSVALDEMHAASRPAPPMPLTEQERLLLRLVHKDDPVELAMLDSMLDAKLRALQDSEDKAEFQRFFGQSTKQVVPEQPVMESAPPQQSTTEQIAPGQPATEEATPAQPGTEQVVPKETVPEQTIPEHAIPEQPVPDQPTQQQTSTPERSAPDQSTTQQATPRPTRTGDKE